MYLKILIVYLSLFCSSLFAQVDPISEIPVSSLDKNKLDSKAIEEYGAEAFYEAFYSALQVIPQKDGTSLIVDQSKSGRFNANYLGKKFVAFRIHKNDDEWAEKGNINHYPGIISCRYSQVVKVIDANELIVDFAYNGGNITNPKTSLGASGEFFFDNNAAIKKALSDINRPECLLFKSGKTYVSLGAWNAQVSLTNKPLLITSGGEERVNIKISAEDVLVLDSPDESDSSGKPFKHTIPDGALVYLDQGSNDLIIRNVNILATTYMVPRAQNGFNYEIFHYSGGQCKRIIAIENCNMWAQKEELEKKQIIVPKGANWVGPNFGYFAGGGTHDNYDITGYQVIRQYNSQVYASRPYSIKNNDGAGNFQEIVGTLENPSKVIELVDDLKVGVQGTGKYNGNNGTTLKTQISFRDDDEKFFDIKSNRLEKYGPRKIRIEGDAISWYMLSNQYWLGGTSTSITEPVTVIVDGFEFRMGNNGDWRPLMGYKNPKKDKWAILSSVEARMFNQIARKGETYNATRKVEIRKKNKDESSRSVFVWDVACQPGDKYEINGVTYTVSHIERRGGNGHAQYGWNPSKDGLLFGYGNNPKGKVYNVNMHLTRVVFDKPIIFDGEIEMKCLYSSAQYLLDGKPREAELIYDRDFNGHCMYNRRFVNQYFKNVEFQGYFRTTGDMVSGTWQDLWNFPRIRYYENVEHVGGGQHLAKCIKFRYDIEGNEKYRYSIINGGRMTLDNRNEPEEFFYFNQPNGYGYNYLVNPIMGDSKGFRQVDNEPWGKMTIHLDEGKIITMNGSTHNSTLILEGNGRFLLSNSSFKEIAVETENSNLNFNGEKIKVTLLRLKTTQKSAHLSLKIKLVQSQVENVNMSKNIIIDDKNCLEITINGKCIKEFVKTSKKQKSKQKNQN